MQQRSTRSVRIWPGIAKVAAAGPSRTGARMGGASFSRLNSQSIRVCDSYEKSETTARSKSLPKSSEANEANKPAPTTRPINFRVIILNLPLMSCATIREVLFWMISPRPENSFASVSRIIRMAPNSSLTKNTPVGAKYSVPPAPVTGPLKSPALGDYQEEGHQSVT